MELMEEANLFMKFRLEYGFISGCKARIEISELKGAIRYDKACAAWRGFWLFGQDAVVEAEEEGHARWRVVPVVAQDWSSAYWFNDKGGW
jgi:hypothetical protein